MGTFNEVLEPSITVLVVPDKSSGPVVRLVLLSGMPASPVTGPATVKGFDPGKISAPGWDGDSEAGGRLSGTTMVPKVRRGEILTVFPMVVPLMMSVAPVTGVSVAGSL